MSDTEGNFYKYTNKGTIYNFDLDQLTLDELRKFEKMTEKQRLRFIASFELNQNAPMTNEISLKPYYVRNNNEKYGDYALWDAKVKELGNLEDFDTLTDENGNVLDSVLKKINYITPDDIIKAAKAFDSKECNVGMLKKYLTKKIDEIGLFENTDISKLKQLYSRLGVNRNQINQFNKLTEAFTSALKETNTNFTDIIKTALDTFIKALETKLKKDIPAEYKNLINISKNYENINDCLDLSKSFYEEQGDTENIKLCEELKNTLDEMLNLKYIGYKPANTKPEREEIVDLADVSEPEIETKEEEVKEDEDQIERKGPKVEEVKEDKDEKEEIINGQRLQHILNDNDFNFPKRTLFNYGTKTKNLLGEYIVYLKMVNELAKYTQTKNETLKALENKFSPDFEVKQVGNKNNEYYLTPTEAIKKYMPFDIIFYPKKQVFNFYDPYNKKTRIALQPDEKQDLQLIITDDSGKPQKFFKIDYNNKRIIEYIYDEEKDEFNPINKVKFGEGYCGSILSKIRNKLANNLEIPQLKNEINQLWGKINELTNELKEMKNVPKNEKIKPVEKDSTNNYSPFLKDIVEYSPTKLNKTKPIEKKPEELTPLQEALISRRKDIEYSDDEDEDVDWGEGYSKKISLSEFLKRYS